MFSGAAISTGVLNITHRTKVTGILGMVFGVAAVVNGATKFKDDQGNATKNLAGINVALGVGAFALGVPSLFKSGGGASSLREPARMQIAPGMVPTSGGGRLGLVLSARF